MAKYDLPATIDHIHQTTGEDQIIYIGHSQGTLLAFAALSTNSELANKIKLFIALAPIVTVGNIAAKSLRILASITDAISVSMISRSSASIVSSIRKKNYNLCNIL